MNKEIGLAVVGCGTIGRIRAVLARDYPGIGWIGLCDIDAAIGRQLAADAKADFFTTDYAELLKRPEVRAGCLGEIGNCVDGSVHLPFVRGR